MSGAPGGDQTAWVEGDTAHTPGEEERQGQPALQGQPHCHF